MFDAPEAPSTRPPDDTTRRICAAVHYDQRAAQKVLDLVGTRDHSYVAGHDGVDVKLVVSHAAAAMQNWRRHNLFVLAAGLSPGLLFAIIARSFWVLVLWVLAVVIGAAASSFVLRRAQGLLTKDRGPAGWLLLAGIAIVGWWAIGAVLAIGVVSWPILIAAALPAFGVDLFQRVTMQNVGLRQFRRDSGWKSPPEIPARFQNLVADLRDPTSGNATVYGGYRPFVGSGIHRRSWADALRLRQKNESAMTNGTPGTATPAPLVEQTLLEELKVQLTGVGLSNCEIRRWHFVQGLGVKAIPDMFPEGGKRPVGAVNGLMVTNRELSDEVVRPYLWITSQRWGGDIVLNTFIRVEPNNETLFVELAHLFTTPIVDRYDRCDWTTNHKGMWGVLGRESFRGILALPGNLIWEITRTRRWRSSEDESYADSIVETNYGAFATVRELFAGRHFRHYFQEMDEIEYRRTIDTWFPKALKEVVEKHGYEIVDFDQKVMSVFNSYDLKGSQFNSKNMAVGDNARFTETTGAESGALAEATAGSGD